MGLIMVGKNVGTCMVCKETFSYPVYKTEHGNEVYLPAHNRCEYLLFKKIREYHYTTKLNVTAEMVSKVTGYKTDTSQKIINYFSATGALQAIECDSLEEALEMRKKQLDTLASAPMNVLIELQTSTEEDKIKKQEPVDNNHGVGYLSSWGRTR